MSVADDVVVVLKKGREEFLALADSLDHGDWIRETPDNETWTVRDTLSHLTASDRSMVSLVRAVQEGRYDLEAAKGFDLDAFNARQVERRRADDIATLRAEMDEHRGLLTDLVATLDDAQLETPVWSFEIDGHSASPKPLRQRLQEYATHDAYHAAHIRTAIAR